VTAGDGLTPPEPEDTATEAPEPEAVLSQRDAASEIPANLDWASLVQAIAAAG